MIRLQRERVIAKRKNVDLKMEIETIALHFQKAGKNILSSRDDFESYYLDFNKAHRAGVTLRRRRNKILSVLILFLHFLGQGVITWDGMFLL